jgi:crotonobetainyl-CoA:carnitine CoA-transferase CaiB-like acyl-CoA transferase
VDGQSGRVLVASQGGALEGLRVIDVSIARAGPVAVRMLADWGADVIRVEAPGDEEGITGSHTSSDFLNLHRNKRAIALDLKTSEGLEIFYKLARSADVLIENFRPPVKHRLKIDYESVRAINPRLIYGSISGFGEHGPYADRGAVDQVIQGMGGLMSVTGSPGGVPTRAGIAVADLAAGHQLALGVLVALYERAQSGEGQWVSVSLLEAMITFLDFQAVRWTIDGEHVAAAGNHHPSAAPMGTFDTRDGCVNIAASTDRLWRRLCAALGIGELLEEADFATVELRYLNRDRLTAQLQQRLSQLSRAEVLDVLIDAEVPCGPIYSIAEMFDDPQVRHLKVTASIEHRSRGSVDVLRQPVTLSRTPATISRPAPLLGEHTKEILAELGYSTGDIKRLSAPGGDLSILSRLTLSRQRSANRWS